MVLSRFFQDEYKEKHSLVFPHMSMESPMDCAALLKKYLSEEVRCARGQVDEDRNWELHPHSVFYSIEGEYDRNVFKKSTSKTATHSKSLTTLMEEKEICLWFLGSQLEVGGGTV